MARAGRLIRLIVTIVFAAGLHPARAAMRPFAAPASDCSAAIEAVEPGSGIPTGLLEAIAKVESGQHDRATGSVTPWPWTADLDGQGAYYATKQEAIAAVRTAQRDGTRSIDVGCMQINLLHHPDAFSSLEQAFDPVSNVAYAARFLRQLHDQTGDWPSAAALYHSATPALAAEYRQRVMAAWGGSGAPSLLPSFPLRGTQPSLLAGVAGRPFGTPALSNARPAILASARLAPMTGRGLGSYRALPIRMSAPLLIHLRR